MSWRTVVISHRCKLDYKMGFMVVRGEETKRVYLDEMAVLMIEDPAVSFTGCLMEALIEKILKEFNDKGQQDDYDFLQQKRRNQL